MTKNEPLKANRLLPQTGMDSSSMIWLGLGLVNMITAIYLLRKK
ncbi:LPXTG cell wall anchor domain-containing protein [Enterococcus pseudoavium]